MIPLSRPLPLIVYKYRHVSEHSLRLLYPCELYYAAPREFNDPFELEFSVHIRPRTKHNKTEHELRALKAKLQDIRQSIISDIRKQFDTARLGFFSASEPRDHPLMWSHYADGHKGFCVGIHTDAFNPEGIRNVTYSDKPFLIDCVIADDWEGVRVLPAESKDDLVNVMCHKAEFWSYEKEWRVLGDRASQASEYDPSALLEVILGQRMTPGDHTRVRNALKRRRGLDPRTLPVKILLARQKPGTFAMDIVDEGERI